MEILFDKIILITKNNIHKIIHEGENKQKYVNI